MEGDVEHQTTIDRQALTFGAQDDGRALQGRRGQLSYAQGRHP